MTGCKHYIGITDRHLRDLEQRVSSRLDHVSKNRPDHRDTKGLKLHVAYDPLKRILKVSFKEKPGHKAEAYVWRILDELIAFP